MRAYFCLLSSCLREFHGCWHIERLEDWAGKVIGLFPLSGKHGLASGLFVDTLGMLNDIDQHRMIQCFFRLDFFKIRIDDNKFSVLLLPLFSHDAVSQCSH